MSQTEGHVAQCGVRSEWEGAIRRGGKSELLRLAVLEKDHRYLSNSDRNNRGASIFDSSGRFDIIEKHRAVISVRPDSSERVNGMTNKASTITYIKKSEIVEEKISFCTHISINSLPTRKIRHLSKLPAWQDYPVHLHTYIASELLLSQGNSGLVGKVSQDDEGVAESVFAESKQNIPAMW